MECLKNSESFEKIYAHDALFLNTLTLYKYMSNISKTHTHREDKIGQKKNSKKIMHLCEWNAEMREEEKTHIQSLWSSAHCIISFYLWLKIEKNGFCCCMSMRNSLSLPSKTDKNCSIYYLSTGDNFIYD